MAIFILDMFGESAMISGVSTTSLIRARQPCLSQDWPR
jgi:hypothetical protein